MEATINPLEVEAIAEVLMSHVESNDLPNCRLVCKLWKKEVRVHFEKKVTFHIYGTRFNEIRTFMDYASQSFPMFQNLRFDVDSRSWKASFPFGNDLMNGYGRTLQKLKLNFKDESETWEWLNFILHFVKPLEDICNLEIKMSCHFIHAQSRNICSSSLKINNLTTLKLNFMGDNCGTSWSVHLQFYDGMLQLAPNLRKLYWWTEPQERGSRYLIQSLLRVNPPKLQHLFLYTRLEWDMVNLIRKSQFKLKELYLDGFWTDNFEVHLVSGPNRKCTVTPKQSVYSDPLRLSLRVTCHEMKIHLENALAQCGDICCTEMLKVFMSALRQKVGLNQIDFQ